MNLSAEAWLMSLALGLYLWDSAMLLGVDEWVLVQGWRGGWRPAFGANDWKLAGREPFLPNPLTPWRGIVRLRWSVDELLAAPDGATSSPSACSAPWRLPSPGAWPKVGVTLLLLLIFVALPFCLFAYPVLAVTLPVVTAIYATCALTLLALRRGWGALEMEPAAFWKLAWECITCPPFCINAVRKACLRAPARATLAGIVEPTDRDAVHRQLARRIRERIDAEAEGSERMTRLHAAAQALRPKEPT